MSLERPHILFLTSTNLAANPRCYKEVKLLVEKGYRITVVAFHLHNWADEKEPRIVSELPGVEFHYLETTRKEFLPWLIGTVLEKGARTASFLQRWSLYWTAMAASKRTWLMLRWAARWDGKPSLIIAHNPPAFYAAYRMAKRANVPFGLDIEDYHPGEANPGSVVDATTALMKKLLPKAAFLTYASPLIREYCEQYLGRGGGPSLVINNVFSSDLFPALQAQEKNCLQLVWFGQNIGPGRGLEQIIASLDAFAGRIELTLIGNPIEPFSSNLVKGQPAVRMVRPLSQNELCQFIGTFDVGLAIEPGKDLNNGLALSNKIWSYYQAGLYILAFDTPAQKEFIQSHPEHGVAIPVSRDAIVPALENLIRNLPAIRAGKPARFERAKKCGWETESKPLMTTWQQVLQET